MTEVEQLMQLLKAKDIDSFLTTNMFNAISCLEAEPEKEPYTIDGFDEAIIGKSQDKVIYDYMKCVKIFMDRESWTEDESIEWMEYNVVCQDKAIFEMCPTRDPSSRCCTVCDVAPDDYQDEHDQYCEQCEKPVCDDHYVLHTWGTCETCYCQDCSKNMAGK